MVVPRDLAPFDFYPYNPSKSAGWVFVVLFAIGSVVQLAHIIPYRSWFFIPFALGCMAETGGYYGRAWAHDNRRLGDPYLIQLFLLIIAVPFLSATIYMTLSRITKALGAAEYSLIRITWISKIYVLIDIAAFALQIIGTLTLAYGGDGEQQKAIKLVAGGLIFQLAAFVVFVLLAMRIHRRLNLVPTRISSRVRWRRYFWVLYGTSILILVRNLVRILEFLQGGEGTVASLEAYLYVFDAAPMFLVVLALSAIYPGRLMRLSQRLDMADKEGAVPLVARGES